MQIFTSCFHILIVINNLSRVVLLLALGSRFKLFQIVSTFTRAARKSAAACLSFYHHTLLAAVGLPSSYCSSSPSSCLILEKSKSSPVPRLKMSSTSRQVVSKCVVASYDSEMNTCDCRPLSVGS